MKLWMWALLYCAVVVPYTTALGAIEAPLYITVPLTISTFMAGLVVGWGLGDVIHDWWKGK